MDSESIQSYRYKYDVFISFRGVDTRNTFVDHLYAHLTRKGILAFKDDKLLQKGESISSQLLQAIKDSRVSIVVFSKDYASSTWCLDEMTAIHECSKRLKQVVFPVFCDIDPSHVRKQNGVYEDAFVLHTEQLKHDPDKVAQWKSAMTSLAGSAGWDVRNRPEFVEIEEIVEAVIKKLGHKFKGSADDLIGIQPRLEALESLLKLSSKNGGFQVLGIWGMGGIGKTTLATVLYDRLSYQFDACCYIENVRKIYEDGGSIAVQKQILSRTIEEKILDTHSPSEIARIVRNRLHNIKLLVVLDNVDQIEQLNELDIKHVLLHPENEPGFWSRLWLYQDFHHVMMTKKKAIEAKAIVLNQKEDDFKFNELRAEDLSKMEHLKLLILNHKNFSGRLSFLSNSLHYLLWNGYPFISLPSNFQPYHLVELNLPGSSVEQLWTDIQQLPYLKRMDLSNSKNLKMTPCFKGMQNLERLDLSGCISLWLVHSSIGLLTELQFLSLQNCSNLACFDFGSESKLRSLKVMCLSGCTKLENTLDFSGLLNLEYLDMDQCTSLYTIHNSIGNLTKLRFLSLRGCTNLVKIPDSFNSMTFLMTLDLCGCSKFMNFSLGSTFSSQNQQPLIFLDLSFCNISKVPDAIGELRGLERLNLQGNSFTELPFTIHRLSGLSYLNVSHCHRLQILPWSPTESGPSDLVGRYFKTKSGSRDHRSGLYAFDCPKLEEAFKEFSRHSKSYTLFIWLTRLVKEPRHFRCGFDIILPWPWGKIPYWFDYQFKRGSIIRIKESNMHIDWPGFVFCILFEVNNHSAVYESPHQSLSSALPHPFYLSFESEYTEERFDVSLNLERNMIDGKDYLWTIYISQEHCHFVKTGAQITFKGRQGLIMKEWGLRVLTMTYIYESEGPFLVIDKEDPRIDNPVLVIDIVEESNNKFEPKIQLPYNWFISDEDEVVIDETKRKEIDLSNLGLLTD
ncbi:disease resistance protein RUN1 [Trifolium repens]|nr:disease resistance protein RUN1 [Trifolium repens]